MKTVSWSMADRSDSWRFLLDLDVDLALLREAGKPPPDIAERIEADPAIEVDSVPWETLIVGGRNSWRTAIFKLSNRISVEWIEAKPLESAASRELVASWSGTLAAALGRAGDRRIHVRAMGADTSPGGKKLPFFGRLGP